MKFYAIFLLSTLLVLVQCIDIKTQNYEEIYIGPRGTVNPDYAFPNTATMFTKYESTATFTIMGTTREEYLYSDDQFTEVFGPPTITAITGENVVDPVLFGTAATGYYFDSTNIYWLEIPELGIYFNCQEDGTSQLQISIQASLIMGEKIYNETINFYVQKTCYYSGFREGFSIGKEDGKSDDVVKHGVVQLGWLLESYDFYATDPIVIPETEHTSFFRISMVNGYGNQYYEEPHVNVENREILDLKVRGSAEKGGVAIAMPEILSFFYTCKDEGETRVVITMSLGFYGVIEFGFIKACTTAGALEFHENPAGIVHVGVSKSDYANIIQYSRTASEWNPDHPSVVVSTDDLLSIFYVSTLSGREQPFFAPAVSVYPSTAFKVTVSGPAREGGIATGSPQRFVVNYICEKVSEGHVIVTIKLPGYDTVEFGYTKKCVKLIRHHDHIWTANQILIALLAFIVVVILVGIYILKSKGANKAKSSR